MVTSPSTVSLSSTPAGEGIDQSHNMIVLTNHISRMYGDKQKYFGRPDGVTDEKDTKNLHFPGVSSQAAQVIDM